ncbi:alpha/beta hydrolase [Domibacillus epiphyticus]|uniref:Alpha/beta hydrolase n=1 Tax=Domibacillus epiphyticus TaxID=1714355 RepID=A0A1V2A957_9BACI|nr:alpha/beta hydrolase [Domibacillus epiphyticus]OMP67506.1 alpha/beta hydrolase [Domibacillus epiphyticus]
MRQDENQKCLSTMDKTLVTASLIEGFWDRWKAHGVKEAHLNRIRESFLTKDRWMKGWQELAKQSLADAIGADFKEEAECSFQIAGLYYQLMYWLIPERNEEKRSWLQESLHAFYQADELSPYKTEYVQFEIEKKKCFGRVRVPHSAIGVIMIINPIDSAKEELYTYEMDFLKNNFITVSFDGPGQGQTYMDCGVRGTTERWQIFIDAIIDYAHTQFPHLPLYLFGTSSGASWAIYGSCNPKITKAVAVSPAFVNEKIRLPDYFIERTEYILEKGEGHMLPSFEGLSFRNPVLLVHGKQDVMVSSEKIYKLYDQLPNGKYFKEYEEEGHCCNYKLPEIRQLTINWFMKGTEAHDA